MKPFDGSFFDEDYFQKGRETGKSWFSHHHWMPQRSLKEGLAFIDYLGLDDTSYVLDFGCSMGFLVKALRILEIKADGCDISDYALSFAPEGCWNCSDENMWNVYAEKKYTHIIIKDVLEHLTKDQLIETFHNFKKIAPIIICIIPMGDDGTYRIKEYHSDKSHIIIENENWWASLFNVCGWKIIKRCYHVPGIKDHWAHVYDGNYVFVLEKE